MNAAMKITAIEAEVRRAPFAGEVRPAWAPGRIWRETVSTVYFVHTDAGVDRHRSGPWLARVRP